MRSWNALPVSAPSHTSGSLRSSVTLPTFGMDIGHPRRQRDVDPAVGDFLGELRAQRTAHRHLDAGIGGPEARQRLRQQEGRVKIRDSRA